jgi:hypothetical protein
MQKNLKNLNTEFVTYVLSNIGFNPKIYKQDADGIVQFLATKNISFKVFYVANKGWQYAGTHKNNIITEDFTYYKTLEECVRFGVIECCCFCMLMGI